MHERIIGLYERHAAAWDRRRGKSLAEKHWLDLFTAGLPRGGTILDVGCGNGEPIAAHFASSGYQVTGLDSSPSLLRMALGRLPDADWVLGDMRELALGRRFDGIIAWHSFFHLSFDDQRAMFPRFANHLEQGGTLMFTSGPAYGEAIGEFEGEPLYHASLSPDEYRQLLTANGFFVESFTPGEPVAVGPSVWLAHRIAPAAA